MRPIILIITLFLSYSFFAQKKENINLINNFVNDVILKEKLNPENWIKYLDLNNNLSQEGKSFQKEIVTKNIISINQSIKSSNDFKIIHYNNIEKNSLKTNLKYENLEDVYFLVVDNQILVPIIVKDGKIISFFYGLTKHKRNSYPWLLNESNY